MTPHSAKEAPGKAPQTRWEYVRATFSGGPVVRSKVPNVTIYFWIIKVLCTTIGESAADAINTTLGLGLTNTTILMGCIWLLCITVQFMAVEYVAIAYWLTVVLISVFGTLITDNLTDNVGVALWKTVVIWSCLLAASFALWYWSERTLSIHSITTRKREAFYWLVVLFTFALGTGTGDLVAEKCGVGYWQSILIWGAVIACDYIVYRIFHINAVFAFWFAYIFTRPLGASMGDYLSQPKSAGGLGLGPGITSVIFLVVIVVVVAYLTISKVDVPKEEEEAEPPSEMPSGSVVADEPDRNNGGDVEKGSFAVTGKQENGDAKTAHE